MLNKIEVRLENYFTDKFPYSNVIGISRSLIALGTLLTLLFNDKTVLIQSLRNNEYLNPVLNRIA